MRKPTTSLASPLLSLPFLLIACGGDAPAPSEVRSRIASDLGHVLTEANAATTGTTDALPGIAALAMVERAIGHTDGTLVAKLAPHASLTGDGTTSGFDPDAIIMQLNMTLFTDANHQGDGIYKVPASLVCADDVDCATQFAKADLRIRVEENDDALRFAIQVDADHDEPLSIALTHDSLALTVALDDADRALTALSTAFGGEAPNARLAGEVTAKLEILGAAHLRASLAIDQAVEIAFADQGADLDGPDAFRASSAAAQVGSIELDGTAGVGAFALGLGATTVHAPGTDGFDLDLPGATLAATLANGQPLQLTNISLGDRTTTLSKSGAQAIAIDLNPNDGRALDATITADAATGLETLSVSPRLDLRMAVDHAVLGDAQPVYDVTRVLLDGSLRGGQASDRIEVASGTFAISTTPASYGFSATAGQCVTGTDVYDDTTLSSYTQWTVGACQ